MDLTKEVELWKIDTVNKLLEAVYKKSNKVQLKKFAVLVLNTLRDYDRATAIDKALPNKNDAILNYKAYKADFKFEYEDLTLNSVKDAIETKTAKDFGFNTERDFDTMQINVYRTSHSVEAAENFYNDSLTKIQNEYNLSIRKIQKVFSNSEVDLSDLKEIYDTIYEDYKTTVENNIINPCSDIINLMKEKFTVARAIIEK